MSDQSQQNNALILKIASARYESRSLNAAVLALNDEIDWLRREIRGTKDALADLEANAWKYAKLSAPGTNTAEKRAALLTTRLHNTEQLLQLAQKTQERFMGIWDTRARLFTAMFSESESMLREEQVYDALK